MKLNLFSTYRYKKDGSIDYNRSSKALGMTPNDLYFFHKGHFDLIDTPTLMSGVFVGYHPTSKNPMFFAPWMMQTCYHSSKDLRHIREIITRENTPEWSTYDYFIMDSTGKILFRNFEINPTIDENGVIYLYTPDNELRHVVYPAERKKYSYKTYFCYGRDLADLNKHIRDCIDAKLIKTPKSFKKGFTKTAQHPLGVQQTLER